MRFMSGIKGKHGLASLEGYFGKKRVKMAFPQFGFSKTLDQQMVPAFDTWNLMHFVRKPNATLFLV